MDALLRRFVEWKGRRRAAQIILFDGAADYQQASSFFRGALCGIGLTLVIFLLSAPDAPDANLVREINERDERLRDANKRLEQALAVAGVCLNTAQSLERTLGTYQSFLGGRGPAPGPATAPP